MYVVSAVASLMAGLIVFVQYRSRKNALFLLYCASIALWSVGSTGTSWLRASVFLLPSFYYAHVISILGLEEPQWTRLLRGNALLSVILMVTALLCWMWRGSVAASRITAVTMNLFFLQSLLVFFLSSWHFWEFRNRERGVRYVFMYATVLFGLSWAPLLALVGYILRWHGIAAPPFLEMGFSFYTTTLALVCFDIMVLDVNMRRSNDVIFCALLVCWLLLFMGPSFLAHGGQFFAPPFFSSLGSTFFPGVILGFLLSVGTVVYTHRTLYRLSIKNYLTTEITEELNAPLMSVGNATAAAVVVSNKNGLGPLETISYVNTVEQNITLLEDHIAHLLNLAAIYEHKILLDKRPRQLADVLEHLVERMQPAAAAKGIAIEMKLDDARMVDIDEDKIRQIISRLLQNAIKYSDGGTIRVELTQRRDELQVDVIDQGRGLLEHEFLNIFEMRYGPKGVKKNTGVNMAVARGWMTAHGGKIWIASKGKGLGSTATFILPN